MKMKKVKDTKTPTVRQLQNISEDLKDRFKSFVSFSITNRHYYLTNHGEIEYRIYINAGIGESYYSDTWEGILQHYHKLMKIKKEDL